MKRINTFIIAGLVAISLLASCKKNENNNSGTADGQGFSATIEQSANADSKTHGINVGDNQINVVWNDADQILVANHIDDGGTSQTLTYELTEGKDKQKGDFYTGQDHEDFFHPNYAAIYPAKNTAGTANALSGKTATFNIPDTQPYAGSEIFASKTVPMVAYSSDRTLLFKNACGGLRFPMVGSNITVRRVELTTTTFNTSDRLSGRFTVDCTSIDPIIQWQSDGSNTITIDCGSDGVAIGTSPTYFYFMLPPGTLHGLSLTAYDISGNVVYRAANSSDYTIERNKIKKVGANLEVPLKVTTTSPTDMEITTAKGGVTSVTNGTAAETGICWGTSPEPIPDPTSTPPNYKAGAVGTTINMTDLTPGTDYYVRAYAKSANNTYYYGDAILFATKTNYDAPASGVPVGALPYVFSVSASQKVYFSRGNLQYQASTNTFRFAEDQWIFVGSRLGNDGAPVGMLEGSDNYYISSTYAGWIDLFGWGTSGIDDYTPIAVCYQPYSTSNTYSDYRPYNSTSSNLYTSPGKADWGYNAISNGGNEANFGWRTWTKDEMIYLLDERVQTYRFAQAQIATPTRGVNGLMIFPDGFTWPTELSGLTLTCNSHTGPSFYNDNHITEVQWSIFERYGVAFLPACGYRGRDGVMNDCHTQGRACRYWTSTRLRDDAAVYMDFGDHYWNVPSEANIQSGQGVRLIKNK